MMQRVNADLLDVVLRTPRWFWFVAGGLAVVLGIGVVGEIVMIVVGLQVLGLTNTVSWAVLITNFIFWVGISRWDHDLGHPAADARRMASTDYALRRGPGHLRAAHSCALSTDSFGARVAHDLLGLPVRLCARHLAER